MLDVESGSLYSIDDITKAVIEWKKSPELIEEVFSRFNESDVNEVVAEIDQLILNGKLFTPTVTDESVPTSNVIKAMCLNVCHTCNLACEYCFADEGKYNGERAVMDVDTAKRALDFLIANSGNRNNLEVDFFGGEPMLNFDVVRKTVEYGRQQEKIFNKNFRFTITTNAYSLSNEAIDFFNREMHNVVLSIDGRKNVHNRVRKTSGGKNSFDAVIENVKKFIAKRGDKQHYVRGTYTALNKDFSADAIALNDFGFQQVSLEPVVLPKEHPLSLNMSDVPQLKDEYEKLSYEYVARRKAGKPFSFFHFVIDLENGPCERKRCSSCGAGTEYVAVTPSGDIYPCHQFVGNSKFCMGNISNGKVDANLKSYFDKNHLYSKPNCVNCWAKYYCSGGCAANAYNFNGTISVPHEVSCELMRKRLECALAIYAIENKL